MGFAANSGYLMMLISRKDDLELESQMIGQHRMYLGNQVIGLYHMGERLEAGSPGARLIESRLKALEQADKMLEMQLNRINQQRDAAVKELESTNQVVRKNIEMSFGLMGQR